MRVLETPIDIFTFDSETHVRIKGIWDTGATGSTITTKVVNELGLIPTGMTRVHTANGIADQNTYTIDLGLPNGIKVKGITVTEVGALSDQSDALIGMDIISLGDFSVTNYNGQTCFSFRIPSNHEIDYVQSNDFGAVKVEKKMSIEDRLRAKRLNDIKSGKNNKK